MDKTFYNVIFYSMLIIIIILVLLNSIPLMLNFIGMGKVIKTPDEFIYILIFICVLLLVYVIVYGFTNLSYKVSNGNERDYKITKKKKYDNKWTEYGVFYIYTDKSYETVPSNNNTNEIKLNMIDNDDLVYEILSMIYDKDTNILNVSYREGTDDDYGETVSNDYKISYNDFKNYMLGHVKLEKTKNPDKLNLTLSVNKKIVFNKNISKLSYAGKKIQLQISQSDSDNKYNIKSLKDPRWMYNVENSNNILYKMNN